MEIYSRLPNELKRIIKWYALCSPHKKSLVIENNRCYSNGLSEYKDILDCFHKETKTIIIFGEGTHFYFTCEMFCTKHELIIERNHRLLWYYCNDLSIPSLIDFITSNIKREERDWVCTRQFKKQFYELDLTELNWFKDYLYHTV